MQGVPGLPIAPATPAQAASAYPNILPGPFILLLLLPAFPLILFSIGARPLDTSALPFTTDDLWQTTAFITVAGAVVLSMGLYPGMLSDVTAWVKDGSASAWRTYLVDVTNALTSGDRSDSAPPNARQLHPHHTSSWSDGRSPRSQPRPQIQQPLNQVVVRYEDIPGTPDRIEYRPSEYRQDRRGNVVYRPGARKVIPGTSASRRMVLETIRIQPQPVTDAKSHHLSLSSQHLSALRESGPYYAPTKPPLPLTLLVLFLTVAGLIVVTGKVLHATYDSDTAARKTSPSSKGAEVDPWHMRELAKRKKETEKETIARNKDQEASFVGRLAKMDKETRGKEVKKRKQEMELLRKELAKRKLPLVALDWDYDGKGKKTPSGSARPIKSEAKGSSEAPSNEPGKLKKMLLGPLANQAATSSSGKTPAGGPSWKPADDAVAHAAIRGGAARAESMANNLVAQKGS